MDDKKVREYVTAYRAADPRASELLKALTAAEVQAAMERLKLAWINRR